VRAAGEVQRRNFAVATAAAEAFLGRLDVDAVRAAAATVEIPGRLEITSRDPLVIHDGAHNPQAAWALAEALPALVGDRPLIAVVAILDDKDSSGILEPLLPLFHRVVFTRVDSPRALPPATLQSLASRLSDVESEVVADPRDALQRARDLAGRDGAVIATGSLHLVA